MIKVYVASKFEEKEAVRVLMGELSKIGVTITHDWTVFEIATADKVDCAVLDVDGVMDANFVVVSAVKELQYAGSYVEMGVAIGCDIPVFVIGSGMNKCVFINHPNVKVFKDNSAFLKYFKRVCI